MTAKEYRPDIDGLRAIAVLAVLGYHYGLPMPGGFTGVDVFFVISGYLITAGLVADIRSGRFSILNFYDRRIRRIWPALIVMLACSMVAGYALQMPGDYKDLSASAASASLGASNFYFLWNTGYFDQRAELMPLLHTWSLAVEEQFYLFWPPTLFLIARLRKKSSVLLLAVLTAIGFIASIVWFHYDPKSAFFNAVPRAWELTLGALLVFAPPLSRTVGSVATIAGLAVIFSGFANLSAASFPGASALYPCIGATFVVWPRSERAGRGARPGYAHPADWLGCLSPIGLISYSLYLWHWPVFVFFRVWNNNLQPSAHEAAALVVLSILISILSYRFIERPFRRGLWHPTFSVWAGLAGSAAVFVVAMAVHSSDGAPGRLPAQVQAVSSLRVMLDWPCPEQPGPFGTGCGLGDLKATRLGLALGDSEMEVLLPILDVAGRNAGVKFGHKAWCLAFWNPDDYPRPLIPGYRTCPTRREESLELIRSHPDALIVIAARWLIGVLDLGGGAENLEHAVERLLSDVGNRPLVLIAEAPFPLFDPIPCVLNAYMHRAASDCASRILEIPRTSFDRDQGKGQEVLRRIAIKHPRVKVVFPADGLCNATACRMWLNGEYLYRDADHFRRNLAPDTREQLERALNLTEILRAALRGE
jgi:peptidoglycan/LPS O-acetylase OafA/YrhL